jgi:hypothetical protein
VFLPDKRQTFKQIKLKKKIIRMVYKSNLSKTFIIITIILLLLFIILFIKNPNFSNILIKLSQPVSSFFYLDHYENNNQNKNNLIENFNKNYNRKLNNNNNNNYYNSFHSIIEIPINKKSLSHYEKFINNKKNQNYPNMKLSKPNKENKNRSKDKNRSIKLNNSYNKIKIKLEGNYQKINSDLNLVELLQMYYNRMEQMNPYQLKYSYATLVSSDRYIPGAITLLESMIQFGGKFHLIVTVTGRVTLNGIYQLKKFGKNRIRIFIAPYISNPNTLVHKTRFTDTYNKLHFWKMDQYLYRKILFLDADSIIQTRQIDELFVCGDLCASSDLGTPDYLNGGMVVLTPNSTMFQLMSQLKSLPDYVSYSGGEQGFLNLFVQFNTKSSYWSFEYFLNQLLALLVEKQKQQKLNFNIQQQQQQQQQQQNKKHLSNEKFNHLTIDNGAGNSGSKSNSNVKNSNLLSDYLNNELDPSIGNQIDDAINNELELINSNNNNNNNNNNENGDENYNLNIDKIQLLINKLNYYFINNQMDNNYNNNDNDMYNSNNENNDNENNENEISREEKVLIKQLKELKELKKQIEYMNQFQSNFYSSSSSSSLSPINTLLSNENNEMKNFIKNVDKSDAKIMIDNLNVHRLGYEWNFEVPSVYFFTYGWKQKFDGKPKILHFNLPIEPWDWLSIPLFDASYDWYYYFSQTELYEILPTRIIFILSFEFSLLIFILCFNCCYYPLFTNNNKNNNKKNKYNQSSSLLFSSSKKSIFFSPPPPPPPTTTTTTTTLSSPKSIFSLPLNKLNSNQTNTNNIINTTNTTANTNTNTNTINIHNNIDNQNVVIHNDNYSTTSSSNSSFNSSNSSNSSNNGSDNESNSNCNANHNHNNNDSANNNNKNSKIKIIIKKFINILFKNLNSIELSIHTFIIQNMNENLSKKNLSKKNSPTTIIKNYSDFNLNQTTTTNHYHSHQQQQQQQQQQFTNNQILLLQEKIGFISSIYSKLLGFTPILLCILCSVTSFYFYDWYIESPNFDPYVQWFTFLLLAVVHSFLTNSIFYYYIKEKTRSYCEKEFAIVNRIPIHTLGRKVSSFFGLWCVLSSFTPFISFFTCAIIIRLTIGHFYIHTAILVFGALYALLFLSYTLNLVCSQAIFSVILEFRKHKKLLNPKEIV